MLQPTVTERPKRREFLLRQPYSKNSVPIFKIPRRYYFVVRLTAIFFLIYAFYLKGFNFSALLSSLLISLPIGYVMAMFETQTARTRLIFRRQPFWMYLLLRIIRSAISFSVILIILVPCFRLLGLSSDYTIFPPRLYYFFHRQYYEMLTVSLLATSVISVTDGIKRKLGNASLTNILIGKYHNARHENRIFLFVDLNCSTRLAEEMGDLKYSEFMQDFFYDLGDAVEDHLGEVYQYVGDEVVISWPENKGFKNNNCIECFLDLKEVFEHYRNYYEEEYGHLPNFKGALHVGGISIAEVGKLKSEIAYYGDVLNATSRMVNLCHELKYNLLVSDEVRVQLQPDAKLDLKELGEFTLRGKMKKIALYGLQKEDKQGCD